MRETPPAAGPSKPDRRDPWSGASIRFAGRDGGAASELGGRPVSPDEKARRLTIHTRNRVAGNCIQAHFRCCRFRVSGYDQKVAGSGAVVRANRCVEG